MVQLLCGCAPAGCPVRYAVASVKRTYRPRQATCLFVCRLGRCVEHQSAGGQLAPGFAALHLEFESLTVADHLRRDGPAGAAASRAMAVVNTAAQPHGGAGDWPEPTAAESVLALIQEAVGLEVCPDPDAFRLQVLCLFLDTENLQKSASASSCILGGIVWGGCDSAGCHASSNVRRPAHQLQAASCRDAPDLVHAWGRHMCMLLTESMVVDQTGGPHQPAARSAAVGERAAQTAAAVISAQ